MTSPASEIEAARGPRPAGRGVGVLAPIAVGLFALAALLAAAPALTGGPERWAGLALLAALAAVALIVLPLLRRGEAAAPAEPDFEAVIQVLGEPAAIVSLDGRILAANGAWRTLI